MNINLIQLDRLRNDANLLKIVSINVPVGEDNESTLVEFIADTLQTLIERLTDEEKQIIKGYYYECRTTEELAGQLSIINSVLYFVLHSEAKQINFRKYISIEKSSKQAVFDISGLFTGFITE